MALITTALLTALSVLTENSSGKQVQITTDFESRARFERRIDRDFISSAHDNRSELLWRVRPGATFKTEDWTARIQFQYANSLIWTQAKNFSTENVDATLAYFQFGTGNGKVTVGRQKINLGDERLIGTLEWSNLSRSMDGIRYQNGTWDAFAFEFGVAPNIPTDAKIFAVSNKNNAGTTSYILKTDDTPGGDVTVHTLDHVWKGKVTDKISAEFETAVQTGEVGSKDLDAYAAHFQADYTASPKLSFGMEFNIASGGQSATHTKTFDNLYPTNHKFYGAADLQGWRNMQELSFHIGYKTDPNGSLSLAWHQFWLFDKTDGWYGAGGGVNPRPGGTYSDPTGASGREIGSEIDLTYNRKLDSQSSLSFGIAWFEPGSFIKNLNTGQDRRQVWGYGMVSYKF